MKQDPSQPLLFTGNGPSGKSAALANFVMIEIGAPSDSSVVPFPEKPPHPCPVRNALLRRISVLREVRRLAALSPGDDAQFATWTRARDRGAKLSRCMVALLLAEAPVTRIPSSGIICLSRL